MTDEKTAVPEITTEPATLSFDNDRGASRSTWIAAALTIVIVGWMGSGFILPQDAEGPAVEANEIRPVAVATRLSVAKPVTLYFQAEGQALPDRDTTIRAEASGEVAEVLVRKGADVVEGEVIARLGTKRADAELARAEEELNRVQRDFDNASKLVERGVATQDRLSQARASLVAVQAQVTTARAALEDTQILAPFSGRIEKLSLDNGEFIAAGSDVGRIVDNHPLTVAIQVPQQALTRLTGGQSAEITFITGETRSGAISFVGTSAAPETRTFLAEIDVPNEDGAIPAGISAEILIPTGEAQAHFLSPSIVSLNADGELGVKTVNADNIVEFHPIRVVRAEIDGIWVTGMPGTSEVIVVGQGFVNEGEIVAPRGVDETPSEAASDTEAGSDVVEADQ